jgi:hypothetical protein
MLAAQDTRHLGAAGGHRIWIDRPYEHPKVALLHAVAEANRCRTVWSSGLGFVTVIGHGPDLAGVETIFTSLLVQATRAMTGEGPRIGRSAGSRTRSFRQSFLMAYAHRIGERLNEATSVATEVALGEETAMAVDGGQAAGRQSGGALVRVLADRAAVVDSAVDRMFPHLVEKAYRGTTDGEGWAAGARAADNATLLGSRPVIEHADD